MQRYCSLFLLISVISFLSIYVINFWSLRVVYLCRIEKLKNQTCGLNFLARRRAIDGPSEKGNKAEGTGKTNIPSHPLPRIVVVFRFLRDPRRSVTPEANSDGGDSVGTRYAPLGNWKPLLENETSLPTSWSAAIIHVRLFLHCVRVWLQVFRATSLKVFFALSLSFIPASIFFL